MELYYMEDDADIASAVKEYLESRGFRVTICTRLEEMERAVREWYC